MAPRVSEAVQALSFVARREARRAMPAGRWALVLSLELGWMTPGQARRYVEAAVRAGVLVPEGDEVALAADPASVQVPRGFRPDPDAVPEPPREPEAGDAFAAWLQRVCAATGHDAGGVMDAVSEVQERFGGRLGALAALLAVARDAGLDVRDAARAELERVTTPP